MHAPELQVPPPVSAMEGETTALPGVVVSDTDDEEKDINAVPFGEAETVPHVRQWGHFRRAVGIATAAAVTHAAVAVSVRHSASALLLTLVRKSTPRH